MTQRFSTRLQNHTVLSLSVAFGLALAMPALAENPESTGGKVSDWNFTIGAGAIVDPTYEGSSNYEVNPLPLAEITWRETVSLSTMEGLTVMIKPLDDEGFSVTGGVNYWQGRREGADKDNDDALRGLGNLSGNALVKLGLDYRYKAVSAGIVVTRDIGGDRDGMTVSLKGGYQLYRGPKWSVNGELSTTWADDNYMGSLFGVSQLQATNSLKRYSPYNAEAGVKDVKIGMNVSYDITPSVNMFMLAEAGRLLSDAADSPIVTSQGSESQLQFGLGMAYRF